MYTTHNYLNKECALFKIKDFKIEKIVFNRNMSYILISSSDYDNKWFWLYYNSDDNLISNEEMYRKILKLKRECYCDLYLVKYETDISMTYYIVDITSIKSPVKLNEISKDSKKSLWKKLKDILHYRYLYKNNNNSIKLDHYH